MYQVGEKVIYGTTGICTVMEIGPLSMHGVDRHRQYYTLQPLHQDGSVYVPVEGEQHLAIRLPISREAAETLVNRIAEIEPFSMKGLNYKQRTDAFSAALHDNDSEHLVQVIKAVVRRKQGFRERQQYNADNSFLKKAMNLLTGELAYVLDTPVEEMRAQLDKSVRIIPKKHMEETAEQTAETAEA